MEGPAFSAESLSSEPPKFTEAVNEAGAQTIATCPSSEKVNRTESKDSNDSSNSRFSDFPYVP